MRKSFFMAAMVLVCVFSNLASAQTQQFSADISDGGFAATPITEESAEAIFFPAVPQGGKAKVTGNMLFDLSHSPYNASTIASYYANWIIDAQLQGYNVSVANDFANIMNYDVVVLKFPQAYFSAPEITSIQNYLNAGNILIIFAEYTTSGSSWDNGPVQALCSALGLGIHIQNNYVNDNVRFYINNYWVLAETFGNHCLVEGLSTIVHAAAGQIVVDNIAQALYTSSVNSYLEASPSTSGPFILAAVPDPNVHPTWKVVVTADTNQFSQGTTNFYNLFDNQTLGIREILWCENCALDSDCDDGVFCNGAETCDTLTNQCLAGVAPCEDDGEYCNGVESCDEGLAQCMTTGNPCVDDGVFCNGTEECDETNDSCNSVNPPCLDDNLYCNGVESCNETTDQCDTTGDPCVDDEYFCNGQPVCNEQTHDCDEGEPPCIDDGQYCNGQESCNEDTDQCDSTGDPCVDDGFWCNGQMICDEDSDNCVEGPEPCAADEICNENFDTCESDDPEGPEPRDDDDDDEDGGEEDLWPKGKVSGGNSGCCG